MILVGAAWAAPTWTVVDAPLQPGRATALEIASARAPVVSVTGGVLQPFVEVLPGVWRAPLTPDAAAAALSLATADGSLQLALAAPAPPTLHTPETRITAPVGEPVRIPIVGFDGDAADLEIATSSGSGTLVAPGVVEVVPDDLQYPRWILVGLRDRRTDAAPLVVGVRLRARPRIPLRAEPGARLELQIGARVYGPFVADDAGNLEGRIEQYPGERSATAVLRDDLGNVTRTELPLVADPAPALLLVRGMDQLPGRPPPFVHVAAIGAGGEETGAPTCQAAFGALPTRRVAAGWWTVALPVVPVPQDVRVECTLGDRQASVRVPVTPAVPARLGLRVWPEELRSDFPEAEVRAVLEDWRGDRLAPDHVTVEAAHGAVAWSGAEGVGDYDGRAAVPTGEDLLVARYHAPPGSGPVAEVRVGWAPDGEGRVVHGRALDARRRPLAGVELRLSAGATELRAVTGPDGWASAAFPWGGLAVVSVAHGDRVRSAVAPPGSAVGVPGSDLVASAAVRIRPGRAAGLDVSVEPTPLRAGPGAVAFVTVRVEDGLGDAVTDEPVTLTASEGAFGELKLREDRTFLAEYTPEPGGEARDVVITASTQAIHTSTHLELVPRVVRFSLGPWLGVSSNLAGDARPVAGLDLDARIRSRLAGEALMLRLGVAGTTFTDTVATGVGLDATLRSALVPVSAALLLRDDRGDWSLWAGGGLAAGVHRLSVLFGEEEVARGSAPVFGAEAHAAIARRAFGGEVVLGARGSFLPASDEDVGYDGNLGGLLLALGWRATW